MPQRVAVQAFADPSNTADSLAQSNSRLINWYLRSGAPGTTRTPVYPMRTPGVKPFAFWPAGPIRGLFQYNQPPVRAGSVYVVGGNLFGEVHSDGSVTIYGTVAGVANPVAMCANGYGHQLMIASGDSAYLFDLISGVFTLLDGTPGMLHPIIWCEHLGGRFFALQGGGSRSFTYSALNNGLVWQTILGTSHTDNTSARSWAPDDIARIIRSHTELWILGYRTSEIWILNSGTGNAVIPQSGALLEVGSYGTWSAQRIDNTIIWIGVDELGHLVVYRADGYTPRRISTHAVETALQRSPVLSVNSQTFTMQMRGHLFYGIFIADLETTWLYDVTTDRWTEWAIWDPKSCKYFPHVVTSHCDGFGYHLMGSRIDGTIYACDPDLTTDTITGTLA